MISEDGNSKTVPHLKRITRKILLARMEIVISRYFVQDSEEPSKLEDSRIWELCDST